MQQSNSENVTIQMPDAVATLTDTCSSGSSSTNGSSSSGSSSSGSSNGGSSNGGSSSGGSSSGGSDSDTDSDGSSPPQALPGPPSLACRRPPPPPPPPECRFCFDPAAVGDPLIAPCLCSGSSKYVHHRCLQRWRLMNYERDPFVRCMECRAPYRIRYRWPREIYRFPPERVSQVAGDTRTLFLNFICFFGALFLRTLDKAAGYQVARAILDPYPAEAFTELLTSDTVYALMFYFAAIAWVMTTLFYILLPITIVPNLRQPERYAKLAICPVTGCYIASLHFFWLYYFCKAIDMRSPESYINLEVALSVMNLWTPRYLMQLHNRCVATLNRSNHGVVLDRIPGDRIIIV